MLPKLLQLYPAPFGEVHVKGLYLSQRAHKLGTANLPFVDANFLSSLDGRIAFEDRWSRDNLHSQALDYRFRFQAVHGVVCLGWLPYHAWRIYASSGRRGIGWHSAGCNQTGTKRFSCLEVKKWFAASTCGDHRQRKYEISNSWKPLKIWPENLYCHGPKSKPGTHPLLAKTRLYGFINRWGKMGSLRAFDSSIEWFGVQKHLTDCRS